MSDAANRSATIARIAAGHKAHLAGAPEEALEHFKAAIELDPDNPEANSTYGLMLLRFRRKAEAEAPLRRAVALAPQHPACLLNLSEWLTASDRPLEAAQVLQRIVEVDPNFHWAWDRLGELAMRDGDFAAAARNFERSAKLRPGDPDALAKWARANVSLDRIDDARRIMSQAKDFARQHEGLMLVEAAILEKKGAWNELEGLALDWTARRPAAKEAWRIVARAQWEGMRFTQAVESFQKAIDCGASDAGDLAAFARLCLLAQEYQAAEAALERSEALDPDNSEMLAAKATLLMYKGDRQEAELCCRRSLERSPDNCNAYRTLTRLTGGVLADDEFSRLLSLAGRQDLDAQGASLACFAAADCYDARRQFPEAFAMYQRANTLLRQLAESQGIRYDRGQWSAQVDRLMELSTAPQSAGADDGLPTPIFIIGMPRSGTTLVESVIGAHSKVMALGEYQGMRWVRNSFVARMEAAPGSEIRETEWRQWRDTYRNEIRRFGTMPFATDKNPWNYDAVGIILHLFPAARIIHVRRRPVETCLSIYRNDFAKNHAFATGLGDIGHYYGEYARLMAHWRRVWPGRIFTIQYEQFVGAIERSAPALIEACGLDWEDQCLHFDEHKRIINTLSAVQARNPAHAAVGRADSYASYLAPLVDMLNAAGVDFETGALKREH